MASFLPRRRSLLFKFLVAIPAVWFCVIFVMAYQDKWSSSDGKNDKLVERNENHENHNDKEVILIKPPPDDENLKNIKNMNIEKNNEHLKNDVDDYEHRNPHAGGHEDPPKHDHVEDKVRKERKDRGQAEKPEAFVIDPNAPGEGGKAVTIDKKKLSKEERVKFDSDWQKNAFNDYASKMISLHRSLPDVRDTECKTLKYHDDLPDTSVVICFHNEAWSVLLRTVHSILDRSPPHLIKEIILVDDFSDMDHLKEPLQEYTKKLGKVKVVRTEKREGLIRARLLGYSVATGTVLTYLDSHCECTEGWLEPLLDQIHKNRSNVVCPVIDVIEDDTFKFQYGNARSTSVGGFDWNLQFNWHSIPDEERARRGSDVLPVRSPTMAGGLFSIHREYFTYLGTYDPGMDIWGGENLELSFRAWMCGGSLEILPCSHVGHIFRKRSPYKWLTGVNVVKKNSVRLAEVWMDNYKDYYYERFNHDLGDFGDVSERKELRKRLKCKSFEWYVKNIYPQLFVPGEALASGEIRSKAKPMCVDSAVDSHSMHKAVNMWPCHNQGGNQFWMLSKSSEMRRDDGCLDFSGGDNVIVYQCHSQHGNQEWEYRDDNSLFHVNTQKCMEVSVDGKSLLMRTCTGIDSQIWYWKRKDQAKKD